MKTVALFLSLMLLASLIQAPAHAADPVAMPPTPPGQPQDCAGKTLLRPIGATHTIPPYPPVSVMTGENGTTLLAVSIGTDGVPTDVQTASSSGSVRLDEAARDFVKSNWKWQPPLIDCKASPVRTRVSISWNLHNAGPGGLLTGMDPRQLLKMVSIRVLDPSDYPAGMTPRSTPALTLLMVIADPDGAAQAVALHSDDPMLMPKAVELAKSFRWKAQFDGKPTGAVYALALVWPVPGQPKPKVDDVQALMALFPHASGAALAAPPAK